MEVSSDSVGASSSLFDLNESNDDRSPSFGINSRKLIPDDTPLDHSLVLQRSASQTSVRSIGTSRPPIRVFSSKELVSKSQVASKNVSDALTFPIETSFDEIEQSNNYKLQQQLHQFQKQQEKQLLQFQQQQSLFQHQQLLFEQQQKQQELQQRRFQQEQEQQQSNQIEFEQQCEQKLQQCLEYQQKQEQLLHEFRQQQENSQLQQLKFQQQEKEKQQEFCLSKNRQLQEQIQEQQKFQEQQIEQQEQLQQHLREQLQQNLREQLQQHLREQLQQQNLQQLHLREQQQNQIFQLQKQQQEQQLFFQEKIEKLEKLKQTYQISPFALSSTSAAVTLDPNTPSPPLNKVAAQVQVLTTAIKDLHIALKSFAARLDVAETGISTNAANLMETAKTFAIELGSASESLKNAKVELTQMIETRVSTETLLVKKNCIDTVERDLNSLKSQLTDRICHDISILRTEMDFIKESANDRSASIHALINGVTQQVTTLSLQQQQPYQQQQPPPPVHVNFTNFPPKELQAFASFTSPPAAPFLTSSIPSADRQPINFPTPSVEETPLAIFAPPLQNTQPTPNIEQIVSNQIALSPEAHTPSTPSKTSLALLSSSKITPVISNRDRQVKTHLSNSPAPQILLPTPPSPPPPQQPPPTLQPSPSVRGPPSIPFAKLPSTPPTPPASQPLSLPASPSIMHDPSQRPASTPSRPWSSSSASRLLLSPQQPSTFPRLMSPRPPSPLPEPDEPQVTFRPFYHPKPSDPPFLLRPRRSPRPGFVVEVDTTPTAANSLFSKHEPRSTALLERRPEGKSPHRINFSDSIRTPSIPILPTRGRQLPIVTHHTPPVHVNRQPLQRMIPYDNNDAVYLISNSKKVERKGFIISDDISSPQKYLDQPYEDVIKNNNHLNHHTNISVSISPGRNFNRHTLHPNNNDSNLNSRFLNRTIYSSNTNEDLSRDPLYVHSPPVQHFIQPTRSSASRPHSPSFFYPTIHNNNNNHQQRSHQNNVQSNHFPRSFPPINDVNNNNNSNSINNQYQDPASPFFRFVHPPHGPPIQSPILPTAPPIEPPSTSIYPQHHADPHFSMILPQPLAVSPSWRHNDPSSPFVPLSHSPSLSTSTLAPVDPLLFLPHPALPQEIQSRSSPENLTDNMTHSSTITTPRLPILQSISPPPPPPPTSNVPPASSSQQQTLTASPIVVRVDSWAQTTIPHSPLPSLPLPPPIPLSPPPSSLTPISRSPLATPPDLPSPPLPFSSYPFVVYLSPSPPPALLASATQTSDPISPPAPLNHLKRFRPLSCPPPLKKNPATPANPGRRAKAQHHTPSKKTAPSISVPASFRPSAVSKRVPEVSAYPSTKQKKLPSSLFAAVGNSIHPSARVLGSNRNPPKTAGLKKAQGPSPPKAKSFTPGGGRPKRFTPY